MFDTWLDEVFDTFNTHTPHTHVMTSYWPWHWATLGLQNLEGPNVGFSKWCKKNNINTAGYNG